MFQTASTPTSEKTTIRFVVQVCDRHGAWFTHDAGYAYNPNRKAPGSYRDIKDAKWHYDREAKHRAPGTIRIVQAEVVSTWTEVYV